MIRKINFAVLFNAVENINSNQKKLQVDSVLGVFYGLSQDGHLRLSFLSKVKAPQLESTKLLRISQGVESENVYWTCFDLQQSDAKSVYYTFCENMVSAVTDIKTEVDALNALKRRFITWKAMFKQVQTASISQEVIQGLFGELYFLKNHMLNNYTSKEAIDSWAGADAKSKDYSINREWFEIKTVGVNSSKVYISSLGQLSSSNTGHLVVVKVEAMSEEYSGNDSSIGQLMNEILNLIKDEITEESFLHKIKTVVGDISDKVLNAKFDVKNMTFYKVNDGFPRLQVSDIPYSEIEDVTYCINLNALEKYKEN